MSYLYKYHQKLKKVNKILGNVNYYTYLCIVKLKLLTQD